MTMKASPKVGGFSKLPVTLEEPTTCSYNHNLIDEPVSLTTCPITLESTDLTELVEEEFGEGRAKFGCILEVENTTGKGCGIEIEKPGAAQPEYLWKNLDGEHGHYESLIQFKLKNLDYTISTLSGGGSCATNGDSGSNGEYKGSIPVQEVTVFPEF
jgi:hypothetical protein